MSDATRQRLRQTYLEPAGERPPSSARGCTTPRKMYGEQVL